MSAYIPTTPPGSPPRRRLPDSPPPRRIPYEVPIPPPIQIPSGMISPPYAPDSPPYAPDSPPYAPDSPPIIRRISAPISAPIPRSRNEIEPSDSVINKTATVYDLIELDDINIIDYLKSDEDNIIFKLNNSYFPLNKNNLRGIIRNASNIKFECLVVGTLRRENINTRVPYLNMNSLGISSGLCLFDQIKYILGSNLKVIEMQLQTPAKTLASTVSLSVLNGGSTVNASHCQEGQGGNVYDLKYIDLDLTAEVGGRKKTNKRNRNTKRRNKKTKRKKTKRKTNKRKIKRSYN